MVWLEFSYPSKGCITNTSISGVWNCVRATAIKLFFYRSDKIIDKHNVNLFATKTDLHPGISRFVVNNHLFSKRENVF